MDAASLISGLLLGALLATAATLGVVALFARRRPGDAGLEPERGRTVELVGEVAPVVVEHGGSRRIERRSGR